MQVTTILVDGPYNFLVTPDTSNVEFTNVRFESSGGSAFFFHPRAGELIGTATFTGITGLVRFFLRVKGGRWFSEYNTDAKGDSPQCVGADNE